MSTVNDSDLFVIERSGTQYQVRSDEMSELNDTDLLVVERAGVQYKLEAQDLNLGPTGTIETPVDVLTPVNGSGLNAGSPYNPQSTAITNVAGAGFLTVESDEITGVSGNTLTLASELNLFAFDAGASVSQDSGYTPETSAITGVANASVWNQAQIWRSDLTSSTGGFGSASGNAFDGNTATRTQTNSSGTNRTLTLAPSPGVSFSQKLEVWTDQGSAVPTATWNGNVVNPGGGAWVTVFEGAGTIDSTNPLVISTESANQLATLNGVRLDGLILVDSDFGGSAPVYKELFLTDDTDLANFRVGDVESTGNTVEDIGPGNSLTLSGGTWNVGDTVTGPTIAAATGTVDSTSGSELILSASNGRWVTNAGKKVTTSAAYDVALTFTDDTELANIIGPATQANADGSDVDSGGITLATIGTVLSVDGTTLYGSSVTGDGFNVGKYLKGAEITAEAPSPSEIVFTSMNGGTTAFTGTNASLLTRNWTLESGDSAVGPWTNLGTFVDISATSSQDGSTPWTSHPALLENKYYRVSVEYFSDNALSIGSTQNTFKTGDA